MLHLTKQLNDGEKMGLELTLRALADPTRRAILELLKGGALPAGEIAAHFSISDAAISRHLSLLREAGLVRDRRAGKYIYYELSASVLEEVMLWLRNLKGEDDEPIR